MKIYILGSAGWIPGKNETSCFLVETDENLIMLDAGTGVANLKYYQKVLENYDTLNIILSHYHLDHLIGLTYLLPFINDKKIRIFEPEKKIYGKSAQEILNDLINPLFFSRSLNSFGLETKVIDYDNKLIYATDTSYDPTKWKDIKAEILLHECWEIERCKADKHTSLKSLTEGINSDQFRAVYLIHQNPEWNTEDFTRINQLFKNSNFKLAKDLMEIEI